MSLELIPLMLSGLSGGSVEAPEFYALSPAKNTRVEYSIECQNESFSIGLESRGSNVALAGIRRRPINVTSAMKVDIGNEIRAFQSMPSVSVLCGLSTDVTAKPFILLTLKGLHPSDQEKSEKCFRENRIFVPGSSERRLMIAPDRIYSIGEDFGQCVPMDQSIEDSGQNGSSADSSSRRRDPDQ